jgi:hypothetical protein
MKIVEPLRLPFKNAKWVNDPELGLIDTVLEGTSGITKDACFRYNAG